MSRILTTSLFLLITFGSSVAVAEGEGSSANASGVVTAPVELKSTSPEMEAAVESLSEPMYSAFTERYILDDLKQLRMELAAQKAELIQQIVDREHKSVDRAVAYATDTVTYFFYLVAAASSILVIVGWTSIREIKERVHTFATAEVNKLISEYESRLANIENQLRVKTQDIEQNREAIEHQREVQSLWLRAQQENNPNGKIAVYDQIIKLSPDDAEAITYKADAVLELNEPQWAVNLCHQALQIEPDNAHAYYQLACAYSVMGYRDDALKHIREAIDRNEAYREDIGSEEMLTPLNDMDEFKSLVLVDPPQAEG